ncbi:U6 snRNA phosphodiesterase 1 [Cydia pomonella]|uniref:U6 snRNA phosphodiesterase 1 n=1 Tax=Cydia pomonella TaxID=82600 RepID=UPI002ADD98BE|nr:U6 snRNA phosphodiesterase 1 [Cydia pomonella]
MSGLSYIGDYGSSSEDSDAFSEDNINIVSAKKVKLPTPNLGNVPVVGTEAHVDDPDLHKGRTRSFPHKRGNWASYVYISYPEEENLTTLISRFIAECPVSDLHVCDDFHISLSRTVTLMYHLITPFTKLLQNAVDSIVSFDLGFESVKIYCNEEKSRTFVSLAVDHFSNKSLLKIVDNVDDILADYKLPTFYDNPSLHMSILWANGDKKAELISVIENLNNILYQEVEKCLKTVTVNKVNCKIGNKFYQFALQ